jgi:hypothetical protein
MKLLIESWNKHLKENISEDQKQQTLRILNNWFGYKGVGKSEMYDLGVKLPISALQNDINKFMNDFGAQT